MKRKCRPYKAPLLVVAIIALLLVNPIAEHAHASLTATQSLEIEWRADTKEWAAFGTLVLDLAAGPRWHLTYIHDREWGVHERWQRHDVSVTRYLTDTRSVTFGWRRKVPEGPGGRLEDAWYGILAWQWGG